MRHLREDNIQVIVTPRHEGDFGSMSFGTRDPDSNAHYMRAEADRIVAEIRRHVADFANVTVISNTITVCGSDSWVIDAAGNATRWWPNCCMKDQQEYFDLHAHESDEWFTEHKMDDLEWLQEFRDAKLGSTMPEIPGFEGTRAALAALSSRSTSTGDES